MCTAAPPTMLKTVIIRLKFMLHNTHLIDNIPYNFPPHYCVIARLIKCPTSIVGEWRKKNYEILPRSSFFVLLITVLSYTLFCLHQIKTFDRTIYSFQRYSPCISNAIYWTISLKCMVQIEKYKGLRFLNSN